VKELFAPTADRRPAARLAANPKINNNVLRPASPGDKIIPHENNEDISREVTMRTFITVLCAAAVLLGCKAEPVKSADLSGKKALIIIASKGFRDEEFREPKKALESNGASVTVASSSLDVATGMLGGRAKPDILITDANPDDYDVVIFVGGVGAKEYFDNAAAREIARKAAASGKILCAICIAPSILAKAGVLKDKKATSYFSSKGDLVKGGAQYTGANVEVDGNIITGRGPGAAREFANAIVTALSSR